MTKTYTITGKSDGFGAQYQGVMSGIAYCSFMNYKYIHTPFNKMGHRESPKALSDFIGIPVLPIPDKIDISKGHEQIVHESRTPDKYYTTEVIETIRNHYYSTEKPIIENNDIAIHIRRGDVNSNTKGRYTGNSYYKKVIDSLLEKYPDYNINVFSEGKEEEFNELRHERVSLKLNVDIEIDGGINFKNFKTAIDAGANVLVSGSTIFNENSGDLKKNIGLLKSS